MQKYLSFTSLIFLLRWLCLGFSVSPGTPFQLGATMPPLPHFPATFVPVQFPSQNCSQAESLEFSQTSPLAMCTAWQSKSLEFMPNESSSEISGGHVQLSDSAGQKVLERKSEPKSIVQLLWIFALASDSNRFYCRSGEGTLFLWWLVIKAFKVL